jgi:hypothetical protein
MIVFLNLLLKHVENCTGRVARPELSGKWMGKKIVRCTLCICFHGANDYKLEMGGRDDTGANVGHIEHEEFVQGIGRLRGENSLGAIG